MKLTVLILPTVDDTNTERYHYAAIETAYLNTVLAGLAEAYDLANMSSVDIHSVAHHIQSDRFTVYSSIDIQRWDYDTLHMYRFVHVDSSDIKGEKITHTGGMVNMFHKSFSVRISYNYKDKTHGYDTMVVPFETSHI